MSGWSWTTAVRVLSLLMAAFFFAAAILTAVLQFELTGHPPPEPPDFLDGIVAFFRWETERWPLGHKLPRPSSTLPSETSRVEQGLSAFRSIADTTAWRPNGWVWTLAV